MPRATSGYVTEDGQFFEEKADAEFYERSYKLHQALNKHILLAKLDKPTREYLIREITQFMQENSGVIFEYVNAWESVRTPDLFTPEHDIELDAKRERVLDDLSSGSAS